MRARLIAVVVGAVALGLLPSAPAQASGVVATVPVTGTVLSVAHDDVRKQLWVATGELSLTVVDTATNAVAAVVGLPHYAEAVGVNPDTGRVYVAGDWPARVSVVDVATRAVVATRSVPDFPRRVAVDRSRNKVFVATGNGAVAVLDGATNAVNTVTVGGTPFGVDVDPGRNRVYVADPDTPRLLVLDATTHAVAGSVPLPLPLIAVAANPATNKVYLSGSDQMVVVDGATLTVTTTLPTGVGDVTADPATNRIYTTDVLTDRLHIVDGAADAILASVAVGAWPVPLDAEGGSGRVFVGNQNDATISVVLDDEVVGPPPPPPPPPNQAPDCSAVAGSVSTLWPANRELVPVSVAGATDPDGDAVTMAITGVTQDEPVGDEADAAGLAGTGVSLRAERDGKGDGRVYRVAVEAVDVHGAACTATVRVGVPQRPKVSPVESSLVVDSFGG